MAPKLSELDLLLNKAALQQARLREALGIKQEDSDDAEAQRREDDMFKCEPELTGLGYKAKEDSAAQLKQAAASSENKLRRQMLGKNTKFAPHKSTAKQAPQSHANGHQDSESDDEEGRAASFRSKKTKLTRGAELTDMPTARLSHDKKDSGEEDQHLSVMTHAGKINRAAEGKPSTQKRVTGSYLDEVLAQKAKKRKKKQKKNKAGAGSSQQA